jgi:hypothetical protein
MHWNELDINVNGEHLTHLWLAEVSHMAETLENLNTVPEDISPRVGKELEKKISVKNPCRTRSSSLWEHYTRNCRPLPLPRIASSIR